jgi:hypothetical protein
VAIHVIPADQADRHTAGDGCPCGVHLEPDGAGRLLHVHQDLADEADDT